MNKLTGEEKVIAAQEMEGNPLINRDALIQAVFNKYKVVLGENDPIFHFVLMHDVMLEQSAHYLVKVINRGQQQQLAQASKVNEQLAARAINAMALTDNKREEKLKGLLDQQYERLEQQHQRHISQLKQLGWLVAGVLGVGGIILISRMI